MRNLLVPAIAALLALPAFAGASSLASAYDDASYPAGARATVTIAQRDAAPNAYDDAGLSAPAVVSPAAPERELFAEHNPFDDAGLGAPQLAPSPASAPAQLADSAPAGCTCCQS
jgi:hypothetical protein